MQSTVWLAVILLAWASAQQVGAQEEPAKKPLPATVERLVETLLGKYRSPAVRHKQYAQRLRYGIQHYNTRHHPSSRPVEDD